MMKKLNFLLILQMVVVMTVFSQVIPKGMNYQAVAHNLKGEVIPNQKVTLKIYLFGHEGNRRTNHYSEIHEVITNTMGLFNLVIGEGLKDQGEYGLIPWSTENIWMEVAIKEKGQGGFIAISNNKLLAVPYAIHAGTAIRLADKSAFQPAGSTPPEPGVISDSWSVFGNAKTDMSGNPYHINSLGTTDKVDLIMITYNLERLRILTSGDILTKLNFEVGKNLDVNQNLSVGLSATIGDSLMVKKNVLLNTKEGSTINYGPFTVENQNPTLLTGKLTVDQGTVLNSTLNADGATDINARFFVNNMSPTLLTGTLQVDSITNLNDALHVNNMSPSYLSGSLRVDDSATFMDKVKILSMYSTDTSGMTPTGSLQVGGGTYIKKNFYVGGIAKFGGPVAFGGPVSITDGTQSNSPAEGALKVSGGVGIGLNLNVGGASMIGGMATIKDLSQSFNDSTGALKVLGGVGIRKRLNVGEDVLVGDTLQVSGSTTVNDSMIVKGAQNFIANFINHTNQHGIRIQIGSPSPGDANHFVEFRNSTGGVVGRIEGENANEYMLNPRYTMELQRLSTKVDYGAYLLASSALRVASGITFVVAAATSFTFCVGLGACTAAPIISFIVQAAIELASAGVQLGLAIVGFDAAKARRSDFLTYTSSRIGVTYESGAGDYAEWLPRWDPKETFLPGQIVGLKDGKITKNLDGTTKLLVISTNPIVLGNMQEKNAELPYEKVAFLGQVPVHVTGKVIPGDYILPSGNNDGLGIAVSPGRMRAEDYSRIVGKAWSGSDEEAYHTINVAVGMHDGDISHVVAENKSKLNDIQSRLNKTDAILSSLLPAYKETRHRSRMDSQNPVKAMPDLPVPGSAISVAGGYDWRVLPRDQVLKILDMTEKTLKEQGVNAEADAFWNKINTEPGYKEGFIQDMQAAYKKEMEIQIEKFRPKQ